MRDINTKKVDNNVLLFFRLTKGFSETEPPRNIFFQLFSKNGKFFIRNQNGCRVYPPKNKTEGGKFVYMAQSVKCIVRAFIESKRKFAKNTYSNSRKVNKKNLFSCF